MNTERTRGAAFAAGALAVAVLLGTAAIAVRAQPAAAGRKGPSPVEAPISPVAGAQPAALAGSGPGVHSPLSPIPSLKDRDGVVPWSLLSSVTTRVEGAFVRPVFPKPVQALHQQEVTVHGFMMPLDPGDKQKHFLLSAVPTTCSFCVPAGPEGLIEVRSRTPVRFSQEAVVVRGKMSVLSNDPYGVFYRVSDAQPVK